MRFVFAAIFCVLVTESAFAQMGSELVVTRINPDTSQAGTAYGTHDTYKLKGVACESEFVVTTPNDDPKRRTLSVRDGCPVDTATRSNRHKLLLTEILKNHGAKAFTHVIVTGDFGPEAEEKLALAALASPKWSDYRKRIAKNYEDPNKLVVELFNENEVGRSFVETFRAHGLKLKLNHVEKVFTRKANELPFAKNHAALAKSKVRLPYSAGVFEFKVLQ